MQKCAQNKLRKKEKLMDHTGEMFLVGSGIKDQRIQQKFDLCKQGGKRSSLCQSPSETHQHMILGTDAPIQV